MQTTAQRLSPSASHWTDRPHAPSWLLVLFYLIPLLLLSCLTKWSSEWTTFSVGLLLSFMGATPLYLFLRSWEERAHSLPSPLPLREEPAPLPSDPVVPTPSSPFSEEQYHELAMDLAKMEEISKELRTERNGLQESLEQLQKAKEEEEAAKEGKIEQQTTLLSEYQETIQEQREILERKQHYILQLENKVRDLSYEIKTLLHLEPEEGEEEEPQSQGNQHPVLDLFQGEAPSDEDLGLNELGEGSDSTEKVVQTPYDASLELQKCIDLAKGLRGADHLTGGQGKLLDLSSESYAIDLRRLFDTLRNEACAATLLYSQAEERLIFANPQVKALFGWGADKFVTDFVELIDSGLPEWKHALSEMRAEDEVQLRLLMKTKTGENLLTHFHLAQIPSGAFSGHVIGVLYAD